MPTAPPRKAMTPGAAKPSRHAACGPAGGSAPLTSATIARGERQRERQEAAEGLHGVAPSPRTASRPASLFGGTTTLTLGQLSPHQDRIFVGSWPGHSELRDSGGEQAVPHKTPWR